jgi:hypothetical protein
MTASGDAAMATQKLGKAAHLESGARDLHRQGTGAPAAEGTPGGRADSLAEEAGFELFVPLWDQCLSELVEPCAETTWRARGEFLRSGTVGSNPAPSSAESAANSFGTREPSQRGLRPFARRDLPQGPSWRPHCLGCRNNRRRGFDRRPPRDPSSVLRDDGERTWCGINRGLFCRDMVEPPHPGPTPRAQRSRVMSVGPGSSPASTLTLTWGRGLLRYQPA